MGIKNFDYKEIPEFLSSNKTKLKNEGMLT